MASEGETANEIATKPVTAKKAATNPTGVLTPAAALGGPVVSAPAAKAPAGSTDAAPAAAEAAVVVVEDYFEILEDIEVPNGASTFPLRRGQKIKAGHYDIDHLQACGVKLRKTAAPPPIVRHPAALPSVIAQPPSAPGPEVLEDVFEVLESIDVPREDGYGTFRLSAGQRFKRGQYDVAKLEEHAVRLKIVAPAVKPAPATAPGQ